MLAKIEKVVTCDDFLFAKKLPKDLSKMDVVFDSEANGLLHFVTKIWCIVAQDYKTREFYVFTDQMTYDFPCHGSLEDGVTFLTKCRSIIAHNVSGYDWWLLNKFYPKIFNKTSVPWKKTHDTYTQSKAQWYDRPARRGVKGNHGLAYYGDLLGYPKEGVEDWSYWDRAKLTRCITDVEINTKALDYLNEEKHSRLSQFNIDFSKQTNYAKYTQFWCTLQGINGMKANKNLMLKHVETLNNMTEELRQEIEPLLPKKVCVNAIKATWEELRDKWPAFYRKVPATVYVKARRNGEVIDTPVKDTYFPVTDWLMAEPKRYDVFKWRKKPNKKGEYKYSKSLCTLFDLDFDDPEYCDYLIEGDFCKVDLDNHYRKYKAGIADHFGFNPIVNKNEDPDIIGGAFTRVSFEDVTLSQHAEVKEYLLSLGWIPTEYNKKKDAYGEYLKNPDGSFVNGSPKLTEDSFSSIPEGVGQKIATYNTLMHRKRTFINEEDDEKGWLNQLDSSDRIRAEANVFNTSTSRMTQAGIVNCPSPYAVFGKQMREVWIAEQGHSLISVDMNSAQLMLLAGFMQDQAFITAVKEGIEVLELEDEPEKYFEKTDDGKYKVYHGTDAHTLNSVYFQLNTMEDIELARQTQDPELIHKITGGRKKAKNGIYALLFGSGDKKFARTVGLSTATEGKNIKENYFKRLPKLKAVKDKLEKQFDENRVGRGGYIQVAGGVWLYCESKHKVLNYLLMGSEAQLQNVAIIWKCSMYEKEGIPAKQVLTIHDEQTDEVPDDFINKAKDIMNRMYYEASQILGLSEPVTGEATVGRTYLDVH